jgi:hypothetical protein
MFSIATALTRLAAGPRNLFLTQNGVMSPTQQLHRVNEIMETWYNSEDWRGVREIVELTTAAGTGIISLPAGYWRAEKRFTITSDEGCGGWFEIKPLEYLYQPNGPGWFDVTKGCIGVAIDLGDDASGVRRYQLVDDPDTLDTYTFNAVLRKRWNWSIEIPGSVTWATATAVLVIPDCYPALEKSVRAMAAADEGDEELSNKYWADAYQDLDNNVGQFNKGNDLGVMQIDQAIGAGQIPNLV